MQHVLALCVCSFNKGNGVGVGALRRFVSDVCVCMFYVLEVIGFAD